MDFTLYDKAKYYTKYLYDTYYLKIFPYKNIIIYDDVEEESCMNYDYYNHTRRLNYISWGYDYSYIFPQKRKIIIDYSGNKEFNTTFFAESHNEINEKINTILKNNSNNSIFNKKIKTKFPNFIENVFFITKNNDNDKEKKEKEEIEVTEIINNSIEYENNDITFHDIAYLKNINVNNIESIKIVYVKMLKKLTKELNFTENKNKDISMLNEIY
jgi:hypothetical protein